MSNNITKKIESTKKRIASNEDKAKKLKETILNDKKELERLEFLQLKSAISESELSLEEAINLITKGQ